jgi:tRNA pseudouridine38-40 synthase
VSVLRSSIPLPEQRANLVNRIYAGSVADVPGWESLYLALEWHAVPKLKMTLGYDGTAYRGFQWQPGEDTIQARLESALSTMAKEPVRVTGAGRTDSGVHAVAQVAHFELTREIPPRGIREGLNSLLPGDIRVREVEEVSDDFHARFDARSKTYRYYLDRSEVASPLRCRYTLHYPYPLDAAALQAGARLIVGERDFAAFRASSCAARTTVRRCARSAFFEEGRELIYEIEANGFLHHMVRNVVGTLLEVGRGKREPSSLESLFHSRRRPDAGPTAPARGLHLIEVRY